MMQPSNTPPDGDFVRYLERLTAMQAVPGAQPKGFMPKDAVPAVGLMSMKAGLESMTQIPLLRHVKWAIGLWIATQILARFVPGAGFLVIPLLAAYAAGVIYTLNRKPGVFFNELGARARRAVEEVRKVPSTPPKNKP